MKHKNRPWRKIVRATERMSETISLNRNLFSWRALPVTTLVLECGHEKVVRGESVPKHKTICKQCEAARG